VTDHEIHQTIDRRIREFHSDVCDRVRAGEISDMEANELASKFADRMYREGPYS